MVFKSKEITNVVFKPEVEVYNLDGVNPNCGV